MESIYTNMNNMNNTKKNENKHEYEHGNENGNEKYTNTNDLVYDMNITTSTSNSTSSISSLSLPLISASSSSSSSLSTGISGISSCGIGISQLPTPSFLYSQDQLQYRHQQHEQEPEQEQEHIQLQQRHEQNQKQGEIEREKERYQQEIQMHLLQQREHHHHQQQQQQQQQQLHYQHRQLNYQQPQYQHHHHHQQQQQQQQQQQHQQQQQQQYLQQQEFYPHQPQQLLHHRQHEHPQHSYQHPYRQHLQQQDSENQRYSINIGRWTVEEHELFLKGLKKYGRNWKLIQKVIHTRSATQIRTHAQKFFTSDHYKANKRGRYISRLKEIETYDLMKDLVEQGTIPLTTLQARNITNCMNNCKRRINLHGTQSSQQRMQQQQYQQTPPQINTNFKNNGEMIDHDNLNNTLSSISVTNYIARRPTISIDDINAKEKFNADNSEHHMNHGNQQLYEKEEIRWNDNDIQKKEDIKQSYDQTIMIKDYHRQSPSSSKISPLYSDLLKHLNKELSPLSSSLTRNNSTICKNSHSQLDIKNEKGNSRSTLQRQQTGCINNTLHIKKSKINCVEENVKQSQEFYYRQPFDRRNNNLPPRPETRSEVFPHYMRYDSENDFVNQRSVSETELQQVNKQLQDQGQKHQNQNINTKYSNLGDYHHQQSYQGSLPQQDHKAVATAASIMLYKTLNSSSGYWLHNHPNPSSNASDRNVDEHGYDNGDHNNKEDSENKDIRYSRFSSSKGGTSMLNNPGSMVVDMSVHPTITFSQSSGSTAMSAGMPSYNYVDSTAGPTLQDSNINTISTNPYTTQLSSDSTSMGIVPCSNNKSNMSLILGPDRMMKSCSPLPLTSSHRDFKPSITEELLNTMNLWSEHSLHHHGTIIATQNEIEDGVDGAGNHNTNNLICQQEDAYHPYQNHSHVNETQNYSNEMHRYPGPYYQPTLNAVYMAPQLMNTNTIYAKQGSIYLRAISTDVPSSDTLLESPTSLQSVFTDAETNMHVP